MLRVRKLTHTVCLMLWEPNGPGPQGPMPHRKLDTDVAVSIAWGSCLWVS